MQIIYEELNYNDRSQILAAAKIHESAPCEWDSNWKVTDEGIDQWVKRILEFKDTGKMHLLFAKLPSGEIIGFHWLRLYEKNHEQMVNVDSLWVSQNHRRNGIATELKKRGEEWAKLKGAKVITTNVFCENQKMLDLNLKLGFKIESVKMSKRL